MRNAYSRNTYHRGQEGVRIGANDLPTHLAQFMTIDDTQTLASPEKEPTSEAPAQSPSEATPAAEEQSTPEVTATQEVTAPIPSEVPAEVETSHAAVETASPVEPVKAEAEVPQEKPAVASAPATPAEEPATATSSAKVEVADDAELFDSYMSNFDAEGAEGDSNRTLSKGETIAARIIQIEQDRVFVDLGTKSEGVIPIAELGHGLNEAGEALKVGDVINVVVVKPDGGDRQPIVSKKRADFELIWTKVEAAKESGEMVKATVLERIKGGLVVDVGVRGFVPATHVGNGKMRNIDKYVGQELELKVIEIDRERKKVVLSNREAEEQKRSQVKEDIFKNVRVSDVLEGTVRRITDYGAFVDLGGVDGLLHISEMSWSRINHPREVMKEGQKIQVQVLRLDQQTGKISLGHRQVLPDPWNLVKENYKIGDTVKVVINRLVSSGAFIKLPEGAEAFMPVSEMSNQRIRKPEEALELGAEVEARIIDLKPDQRRMVLSLRDGAPLGGYQSDIPGHSGGRDFGGRGRPGGPGGNRNRRGGRGRDSMDEFDDGSDKRRGVATGGATIGERLGALRGFFRPVDEHGKEAEGESTPGTEAKASPEVKSASKAKEAPEAKEAPVATVAPEVATAPEKAEETE